ncbi:hypothetical protein FBU59_004142 [Linderina macrospora]|uniref:Uncharacterized protein n=1 Tax=Linderina macrospora TaxID=4868 RepID=A0ACC1J6I8_9FUNG|nr:hypothetical protein FBU59_004142 [Linderina macrospora]
MSHTTDYYALLGVSPTATHEEIRRAYYTLSRQVHPDKQVSQDTVPASVEFYQLSMAWETLGDKTRRKQYDHERTQSQNRARGVVQDEIDLDDMDFDEGALVYSYPCRCSGQYTIHEDDLEAGRDMAPCSDCSLKVRVLYEVADDEDED